MAQSQHPVINTEDFDDGKGDGNAPAVPGKLEQNQTHKTVITGSNSATTARVHPVNRKLFNDADNLR